MPEAVVVAFARTAIGRAHKGSLTEVRADDLAVQASRAVLDRAAGLEAEVEDVYLGAAHQQGEQGQNMARRVAVLLDRDDLPAASVSRACASSIQTTRMAAHAIRSGEGDLFLSVGVESVSRYPAPTPGTDHPAFEPAKDRTRARSQGAGGAWSDPRADSTLPDFYIPMGETAENVAELCGVSREDQDEFALRSQARCAAAVASGFHAREIVPITLPNGSVFEVDESPRPSTTGAALAALAPVFRDGGTVTAGNACPLNDGAAALLIASDRIAARIEAPMKARIVSTAVSGLSPEIMGLGPVEASRRALERAGMTIRDIDLVEINEAFAAQVIASTRALAIEEDRVNVHGGAIALGHPFGMTGVRLIGTAIHALAERDEALALVTLCVGMGQGMAMVLERLD